MAFDTALPSCDPFLQTSEPCFVGLAPTDREICYRPYCPLRALPKVFRYSFHDLPFHSHWSFALLLLFLLFQLPFQPALARLTLVAPFASVHRCPCQLFRSFFALQGEQIGWCRRNVVLLVFWDMLWWVVRFFCLCGPPAFWLSAERLFWGARSVEPNWVWAFCLSLKAYYVLIYNNASFEQVIFSNPTYSPYLSHGFTITPKEEKSGKRNNQNFIWPDSGHLGRKSISRAMSVINMVSRSQPEHAYFLVKFSRNIAHVMQSQRTKEATLIFNQILWYINRASFKYFIIFKTLKIF